MAGSDSLFGGNGNDFLNGGANNDVLDGGSGNDAFVFNSTIGATKIDQIQSFNAATDTIRLDNAVFFGFATGLISATAFSSNTTGFAGDASDRIIYESDTGRLYFDADGDGAIGRVQFAQLSPSLALTYADFFVF